MATFLLAMLELDPVLEDTLNQELYLKIHLGYLIHPYF